jgi:dihydrofolate reductase
VIYEQMAAFWPTADQDPTSEPVIVEYAGIWRDMPKVVYSRTLSEVGDNATLVREVVPEQVRELQQQGGGDMAVGGAELAAEFMRLGLVDAFMVYVHPVVLGRGRRMFAGAAAPLELRLTETRTFGSGVVLLRYERS